METFAHTPLDQFVDQAASSAPVPGGGAVAALVGALGGAMASMAVNLTLGKKKYAQHDALMREFLETLTPVIDRLKHAADADAKAFSAISVAYKLPKENDEQAAERRRAVEQALTASMKVPLGVTRDCRKAAELLPRLAETANFNLLSDVEVAAIMLEASARAALINVLANTSSLRTVEAREAEAEANLALAGVSSLTAITFENITKRRSEA